MPYTLRTIFALLALVVTALLAGCGGGGSNSSSTSTASSTTATSSSAPGSPGTTAASTGSQPTLAGTDYAARANAICKAARTRTAALLGQVQAATTAAAKSESSASVAPLLALVKRLYATAGETLFSLKALKPPAGAKAVVDSFVLPLAHAVSGLERAAVGIQHGQAKQAVGSLFQLQAATPELARAAKAVGLGECEGILSAAG